MTTLLAVFDFNNLTISAVIGAIIGAVIGYFGAINISNQEVRLLERQLRIIQQKLDLLMKHQGVELPAPPSSGLSPEVERLASTPQGKIAAIKMYRKDNPG